MEFKYLIECSLPIYLNAISILKRVSGTEGQFTTVTTNFPVVEFNLYNTIAKHIFSTEAEVADGQNNLWNGSNHARGYYFLRLKYWDMQGLEFSESGKVLLVR